MTQQVFVWCLTSKRTMAATLSLFALGSAVASPIRVNFHNPSVKFEAPVYHAGWHPLGIPHQEESVKVMFAAKQQNQDVLTEFVKLVSDPKSSKYGQYMTMEQVNKLTKPTDEDVAAIVDFLQGTCAPIVDSEQGLVSCEMTVASAEQLFNTEFRRFTQIRTGQSVVRARGYELPASVHSAIDAVYGLHGIPLPPKTKNLEGTPGMPPAVTPQVLYDAYNIKGVKPTGSTKNRMAVAEFQGQFMNKSDLKAFFAKYLPDAPDSDSEVYQFHGGSQNGDGIEAELDIQFIMGTAPGIKTDFYEQANMDFCADLKNWTTLLLSDQDSPQVHSVSYGWQGNLTQIGCQPAEVTAIDADYKKLAAAGISIIFASGDSGSGYAPPTPPMPPQCSRTKPGTASTAYTGEILANLTIGVPPNEPMEGVWICCQIAGEEGAREGYAGWTFSPRKCEKGKPCEASCLVLKTITGTTHKMGDYAGKAAKMPPAPPAPTKINLWPSWPASSPYVTSVGATRFINDVVGGPEAAVGEEDHFGSGGGFSPWTFLDALPYAKDATTHYLSSVDPSTLPPKDSIPTDGRATPDVSALGTGYAVVAGGKPIPGGVGGTSASAPVFAGIVALLNEARAQAGKPAMGLVSPFVYANADVFTDVVAGSDKVGRGGGTLKYGYNCSAGWDPVTGMGTPIFDKMLKAAMDVVA
mmetsp:Transcript_34801/g.48567  ORF Transcript_34801/g.48567 Transcript_34801/m.48567 type:complete len:692 (-) Transcript_34801:106-2181(-)